MEELNDLASLYGSCHVVHLYLQSVIKSPKSSLLTFVSLCPWRIPGERRWRWPVPVDAAADHHPLALLWHLPVLCRAPPAQPAPPVPARQTLPHGRHRLLAGPLDYAGHRSQDKRHGSELYHRSGGTRNDSSFLIKISLFLNWSALFRLCQRIYLSFKTLLSPCLSGAPCREAGVCGFSSSPVLLPSQLILSNDWRLNTPKHQLEPLQFLFKNNILNGR